MTSLLFGKKICFIALIITCLYCFTYSRNSVTCANKKYYSGSVKQELTENTQSAALKYNNFHTSLPSLRILSIKKKVRKDITTSIKTIEPKTLKTSSELKSKGIQVKDYKPKTRSLTPVSKDLNFEIGSIDDEYDDDFEVVISGKYEIDDLEEQANFEDASSLINFNNRINEREEKEDEKVQDEETEDEEDNVEYSEEADGTANNNQGNVLENLLMNGFTVSEIMEDNDELDEQETQIPTEQPEIQNLTNYNVIMTNTIVLNHHNSSNNQFNPQRDNDLEEIDRIKTKLDVVFNKIKKEFDITKNRIEQPNHNEKLEDLSESGNTLSMIDNNIEDDDEFEDDEPDFSDVLYNTKIITNIM